MEIRQWEPASTDDQGWQFILKTNTMIHFRKLNMKNCSISGNHQFFLILIMEQT